MPIKIQNDLPAREIMEKENILVQMEHLKQHIIKQLYKIKLIVKN